MSVVAGVGKAAGVAEMLTRRGEARQGEDLSQDEEGVGGSGGLACSRCPGLRL